MKKAVATILFFAFVCALNITVLADTPEKLEIEQYNVCMPSLKVFFRPLDSDGNVISDFQVTDVKAVLGSKSLQFDSVEVYTQGTTFYFLLDISGSISSSTFKAIKESLSQFITSMSANDAVVLITFGQDVTVVLDGTESRQTAIAAIEQLKASDKITRFFDAITSVVNIADSNPNNLPNRRIALLITDGKDVSDIGSTTQTEMQSALIDAHLPLYAMGVGSEKDYLNALGEFSRSTGGQFAAISKKNCKEVFDAMFSRINQCYVMQLHADSNIIEQAEQQLIIKVTSGGKELSMNQNIELNNWIPDTEAPVPSYVGVNSSDEVINKLAIKFSEAVIGANDIANFSVRAIIDDQEYTPVLKSVYYDESINQVTLTFENVLYTGKYSISFANITDKSMEANSLSPSTLDAYVVGVTPTTSSKLTDLADPATDTFDSTWLIIGIIVLICVIAGLIILAIFTSKKHKENHGDNDEVGVSSESIRIPVRGMRCQAIIVDPTNMQRCTEINVMGAYTVGRSSAESDMAVDDRQMSRRHFMLSVEDNRLYIQDLNSTNGTEVNGVFIRSKHPISDGDTIVAGNSKFFFRLLDNQTPQVYDSGVTVAVAPTFSSDFTTSV